ncbi:hypothetical protein X948_5426 [Burkholderia pseudomallei MSHR5608]|nr:hypothetical protein X948_5426 [Burkholderia pseudomallei MSHR5608]
MSGNIKALLSDIFRHPVRKGSVSDTMNPEQPIWIAEILKLVNGASFDSGWK